MTAARKKVFLRLLGWGAFAAFLYFVFANWADEQEMLRLLASAAPEWIAIAIFCQLGTYLAEVGLWKYVVERQGSSLRWSSLLVLAFVKLFTDSIVPTGGIAGSVLVVRGLERRGATRESATATILAGVLGSYGGIALAVAASMAILIAAGHYEPLLWIPAGVFGVVAIVVPGGILLVAGRGEGAAEWGAGRPVRSKSFAPWGALDTLPAWIGKVPLLRDLAAVARRIPARVLRDPRTIGFSVLMELVILALDAASLYALLRAVGADPSYAETFAALIFGAVTGLVSFVPGGLGTFDAVCVGLLVRSGVAVEPALMSLLMMRGLAQFAPMIPGALLARRELSDTSRA